MKQVRQLSEIEESVEVNEGQVDRVASRAAEATTEEEGENENVIKTSGVNVDESIDDAVLDELLEMVATEF